MPDGVARKIMDSRKINALEWHPATPLEDGIKLAYKDYKDRHASVQTKTAKTQNGAT
jgi:nucleoside-diphosphate-sugar epimerase